MKVAIYCRLSDEDKDKLYQHDDSASIQNQDKICQGVFLQKKRPSTSDMYPESWTH